MKKNNIFISQPTWLSTLLKVLMAIFLILLLICIVKVIWDCRHSNRTYTVVERTGYLPEEEEWENIIDTVPPYKKEDLDSLPEKVSLEEFFPPIGDQGAHGTCVAWAVGYNLNTALNAIKNKWTPDQLKDPANQTSPGDLWRGIDSADKGEVCYGTNFYSALNVLQQKGAANMQTVPTKTPLLPDKSCKGKFVGDSTNRIASFHEVVAASSNGSGPGQLPSVQQIKAYLKDTIPLAISAHLGDSFNGWDDDTVLKSDTYLNPNNAHAYHAMVLSGYDDSKNAFRVRNSWGDWGDDGSIWVDYDYFINGFCRAVFMVEK